MAALMQLRAAALATLCTRSYSVVTALISFALLLWMGALSASMVTNSILYSPDPGADHADAATAAFFFVDHLLYMTAAQTDGTGLHVVGFVAALLSACIGGAWSLSETSSTLASRYVFERVAYACLLVYLLETALGFRTAAAREFAEEEDALQALSQTHATDGSPSASAASASGFLSPDSAKYASPMFPFPIRGTTSHGAAPAQQQQQRMSSSGTVTAATGSAAKPSFFFGCVSPYSAASRYRRALAARVFPPRISAHLRRTVIGTLRLCAALFIGVPAVLQAIQWGVGDAAFTLKAALIVQTAVIACGLIVGAHVMWRSLRERVLSPLVQLFDMIAAMGRRGGGGGGVIGGAAERMSRAAAATRDTTGAAATASCGVLSLCGAVSPFHCCASRSRPTTSVYHSDDDSRDDANDTLLDYVQRALRSLAPYAGVFSRISGAFSRKRQRDAAGNECDSTSSTNASASAQSNCGGRALCSCLHPSDSVSMSSASSSSSRSRDDGSNPTAVAEGSVKTSACSVEGGDAPTSTLRAAAGDSAPLSLAQRGRKVSFRALPSPFDGTGGNASLQPLRLGGSGTGDHRSLQQPPANESTTRKLRASQQQRAVTAVDPRSAPPALAVRTTGRRPSPANAHPQQQQQQGSYSYQKGQEQGSHHPKWPSASGPMSPFSLLFTSTSPPSSPSAPALPSSANINNNTPYYVNTGAAAALQLPPPPVLRLAEAEALRLLLRRLWRLIEVGFGEAGAAVVSRYIAHEENDTSAPFYSLPLFYGGSGGGSPSPAAAAGTPAISLPPPLADAAGRAKTTSRLSGGDMKMSGVASSQLHGGAGAGKLQQRKASWASMRGSSFSSPSSRVAPWGPTDAYAPSASRSSVTGVTDPGGPPPAIGIPAFEGSSSGGQFRQVSQPSSSSSAAAAAAADGRSRSPPRSTSTSAAVREGSETISSDTADASNGGARQLFMQQRQSFHARSGSLVSTSGTNYNSTLAAVAAPGSAHGSGSMHGSFTAHGSASMHGSFTAHGSVTLGGGGGGAMRGRKIHAMFMFCDIRNFTEITEVLEEDVLAFVNDIARVVHGEVAAGGGAPNKNIGDAFLLTWKLPDPTHWRSALHPPRARRRSAASIAFFGAQSGGSGSAGIRSSGGGGNSSSIGILAHTATRSGTATAAAAAVAVATAAARAPPCSPALPHGSSSMGNMIATSTCFNGDGGGGCEGDAAAASDVSLAASARFIGLQRGRGSLSESALPASQLQPESALGQLQLGHTQFQPGQAPSGVSSSATSPRGDMAGGAWGSSSGYGGAVRSDNFHSGSGVWDGNNSSSSSSGGYGRVPTNDGGGVPRNHRASSSALMLQQQHQQQLLHLQQQQYGGGGGSRYGAPLGSHNHHHSFSASSSSTPFFGGTSGVAFDPMDLVWGPLSPGAHPVNLRRLSTARTQQHLLPMSALSIGSSAGAAHGTHIYYPSDVGSGGGSSSSSSSSSKSDAEPCLPSPVVTSNGSAAAFSSALLGAESSDARRFPAAAAAAAAVGWLPSARRSIAATSGTAAAVLTAAATSTAAVVSTAGASSASASTSAISPAAPSSLVPSPSVSLAAATVPSSLAPAVAGGLTRASSSAAAVNNVNDESASSAAAPAPPTGDGDVSTRITAEIVDGSITNMSSIPTVSTLESALLASNTISVPTALDHDSAAAPVSLKGESLLPAAPAAPLRDAPLTKAQLQLDAPLTTAQLQLPRGSTVSSSPYTLGLTRSLSLTKLKSMGVTTLPELSPSSSASSPSSSFGDFKLRSVVGSPSSSESSRATLAPPATAAAAAAIAPETDVSEHGHDRLPSSLSSSASPFSSTPSPEQHHHSLYVQPSRQASTSNEPLGGLRQQHASYSSGGSAISSSSTESTALNVSNEIAAVTASPYVPNETTTVRITDNGGGGRSRDNSSDGKLQLRSGADDGDGAPPSSTSTLVRGPSATSTSGRGHYRRSSSRLIRLAGLTDSYGSAGMRGPPELQFGGGARAPPELQLGVDENPYCSQPGIHILADNALAAALNILVRIHAANLPGGRLHGYAERCMLLAGNSEWASAGACFRMSENGQQPQLTSASLSLQGVGLHLHIQHQTSASPFTIDSKSLLQGFGLHIGWAIEGAIGSSLKIDASYLSPAVNATSRLETATKTYGVDLLISQAFAECLSLPAQNLLRLVDRVKLKGVARPFHLYTFDWSADAGMAILLQQQGQGQRYAASSASSASRGSGVVSRVTVNTPAAAPESQQQQQQQLQLQRANQQHAIDRGATGAAPGSAANGSANTQVEVSATRVREEQAPASAASAIPAAASVASGASDTISESVSIDAQEARNANESAAAPASAAASAAANPTAGGAAAVTRATATSTTIVTGEDDDLARIVESHGSDDSLGLERGGITSTWNEGPRGGAPSTSTVWGAHQRYLSAMHAARNATSTSGDPHAVAAAHHTSTTSFSTRGLLHSNSNWTTTPMHAGGGTSPVAAGGGPLVTASAADSNPPPTLSVSAQRASAPPLPPLQSEEGRSTQFQLDSRRGSDVPSSSQLQLDSRRRSDVPSSSTSGSGGGSASSSAAPVPDPAHSSSNVFMQSSLIAPHLIAEHQTAAQSSFSTAAAAAADADAASGSVTAPTPFIPHHSVHGRRAVRYSTQTSSASTYADPDNSYSGAGTNTTGYVPQSASPAAPLPQASHHRTSTSILHGGTASPLRKPSLLPLQGPSAAAAAVPRPRGTSTVLSSFWDAVMGRRSSSIGGESHYQGGRKLSRDGSTTARGSGVTADDAVGSIAVHGDGENHPVSASSSSSSVSATGEAASAAAAKDTRSPSGSAASASEHGQIDIGAGVALVPSTSTSAVIASPFPHAVNSAAADGGRSGHMPQSASYLLPNSSSGNHAQQSQRQQQPPPPPRPSLTVVDLMQLQPPSAFPLAFFEEAELAMTAYLGSSSSAHNYGNNAVAAAAAAAAAVCADWGAARWHAARALRLRPNDGPLLHLLSVMNEMGEGPRREAPVGWPGFHVLNAK